MTRNRTAEKIERPVLRYFGGKWRIASWIISYFPEHRRYVEPFGGAASVLLQKAPAYNEIYNDIDSSVVNFFRVVRSPVLAAELMRVLRLTPYSREEFVEARQMSCDPVEAARRLCVRSFMGHSSSGVSHRGTGFRNEANDIVKSSSQASGFKDVADLIPAVTERLRDAVIEQMDAVDLIRKFDSEDTLIYCDPPYPFSTRSQKGLQQYSHEMSDEEHAVLMECLERSGSMVVLSGYADCIYDGLGWESVDRLAWTVGGERTERLWINPAAMSRLSISQIKQMEFNWRSYEQEQREAEGMERRSAAGGGKGCAAGDAVAAVRDPVAFGDEDSVSF
ncbi:MAG: DNA adenine methylase [Kiritimatiellales bacterium]